MFFCAARTSDLNAYIIIIIIIMCAARCLQPLQQNKHSRARVRSRWRGPIMRTRAQQYNTYSVYTLGGLVVFVQTHKIMLLYTNIYGIAYSTEFSKQSCVKLLLLMRCAPAGPCRYIVFWMREHTHTKMPCTQTVNCSAHSLHGIFNCSQRRRWIFRFNRHTHNQSPPHADRLGVIFLYTPPQNTVNKSTMLALFSLLSSGRSHAYKASSTRVVHYIAYKHT